MEDAKTPGDLLEKIARAHKGDLSLMEKVAVHPNIRPQTLFFLYNNTDKDFKKRLQELKTKGDDAGKELAVRDSRITTGQKQSTGKTGDPVEEGAIDFEKLSLYGRIQHMTVAEKVQFALKSGKDARSILIKDSNRQVALAVLASPKITEDEVLLIAQSRNVSDDLLRVIAKNRDWMKKYPIVLSLVNNPKTPLPVSMPLLSLIKLKDLGLLSKSRNVPEAIRSGATRLLVAKQKQG